MIIPFPKKLVTMQDRREAYLEYFIDKNMESLDAFGIELTNGQFDYLIDCFEDLFGEIFVA